MSIVDQKIREGKAKMGVCESHKLKSLNCGDTSEQLLFKVTTIFVCGKCLDVIGEALKVKGMM